MTAPASQSDLDTLIEQHADLLLALELAAATAATTDLVKQLGRIQRTIAAAWITVVGGLTNSATPEQGARIARRLVDLLRGVDVTVSDTIREHADQAAAEGQRQALDELGADEVPDEPATVSSHLEQVIQQADTTVQDRINAAVDRAQDKPPETWRDVTDVLSVANQSRAAADRASAWAVNAAANQAVIDEANRQGGHLLWIAERDACVACLAYSGITADPAKGFPPGRTYGDKPVLPWPDPKHLPGPPLHPRCRCRLTVWFGHDAKAAAAALPSGARSAHVSYADALRREADRSILRGFSLPSESERVRLRAADRLLNRGVVAPKTVKQYARAAVRRGGWSTRRVPNPKP